MNLISIPRSSTFSSSMTKLFRRSSYTRSITSTSMKASTTLPNCEVVFVLGAPGTGKSKQCELLVERLGNAGENQENRNTTYATKSKNWTHLSAGELLRTERNNAEKSELGKLIDAKINAGELIPGSIVDELLEREMIKSYNSNGCIRYLIDGFPRGRENIDAWNDTMSKHHTTKFVLNFEGPQDVLVDRLLERGKQFRRSDDNINVIQKRFQTHRKSTVPVLDYLIANDITVHTINAAKSIEQVYNSVEPLFKGDDDDENDYKINAA